MQQILLDAKLRNETGTGTSRRLRRQGRVPAIVYGRKETPLTLEVREKEFEKVVGLDAGQNAIISLNLDKGGSGNSGSGQGCSIPSGNG